MRYDISEAGDGNILYYLQLDTDVNTMMFENPFKTKYYSLLLCHRHDIIR